MKKKVHVISHTHWDREWYLPYEQHHMRLIELFDDLFELFETDPEYKSFHMDGQTLLLDDYLEVRPENRELVRKYVQEGKLKIGPFYILQDDFLISSEANARNMIVGLDESAKWGEPVKLGYFPDTFGNMAQAPQMMKQGGIDAVAFGRGVKTTGFNNVVVDEDYTSKYSEINWKGADGTEIFSLLFANWYSNGNEIPATEKEAREFWDVKLADVERYASTRHLLMMNGVDHQPVQKDVTAAIRLANELYPEYEFVHSSFDEYLEEVQKELPEDIGQVQGELTSQETDGWYTLANTSSSRVYLKQSNTEVQNLLERIAEPLATMAHEVTGDYPHEKLRFAWKKLMQNHPHDSICGCSIDAVHDGMVTRFEDAKQVGLFVKDEALRHLQGAIDTSKFAEDARPFTIFNTLGNAKSGVVELELEYSRIRFNERKPQENYYDLVEQGVPHFDIVDENGNSVEYDFISSEVRFHADLPKDGFRVPHMARYITIRLSLVDMPAFSWNTYALVDAETTQDHTLKASTTLENQFMKVDVNADGTLDVLDKKTDFNYTDIMVFDNAGDIGNEYIFKAPEGDVLITSKGVKTEVESVLHTDMIHTVRLTQTMMLPKSGDDLLLVEQMSVTEMRERKAQRSDVLVPFVIETLITLERDSEVLKFESSYDNQVKDHRLRVVFDTHMETTHHQSESIYEVVERPNGVSSSWQNPSNPQHQQSFSANSNDERGVIVGNFGLNEYELVDNRYIAVTMLRSTGEMGDWGYFPTPGAQCLGETSVSYSLAFHNADDKFDAYKAVKGNQVEFSSVQTKHSEGTLPAANTFLSVDSKQGLVSALKRNEYGDDVILRLFNLDNESNTNFDVSMVNYSGTQSDLIETVTTDAIDTDLKGGEIRTVRFTKEV